jgi:polyisoprenoid-binding protein YceI
MPTYNESNAQCVVYSYKDGLLSKIAHDLKHRVTRFSVRVDPRTGAVEAEIDATSLRVECVVKDGSELENGLSAEDKRKIENQIMADVLNADVHPVIRFRSTRVSPSEEGLRIEGALSLNDCEQPVRTFARRVDDSYQADVTINQPDFNIKPFSAMMGTLKIKPEVVVRVIVPAT